MKENDSVVITARQHEIIMGTLLGDASLKGRSKKTRYLSISHSDKQKDYIFWLYNELRNLCPSAPKPYSSHNKYITYSMISTPRNDFFSLKEKIYIPTKTVNKEWLNSITRLALAVWYMDDGSLNYKNKHRSYFSFATNSFSVEEHYLLKSFMAERHSIITEVKQINRGGKYQCNLVVSDESFDDFNDILKEYVPNFMRYKVYGNARKKFLINNIEAKITEDQLKNLYYIKKMTQQQIADSYGVHRLTISKYMNLFDIKARNNTVAQLGGKNLNAIRGYDGRFYTRDNSLSEISKAKIIFKNLRGYDFPYPLVCDDNIYISIIESLCVKSSISRDRVFSYSRSGLKISSDLCPQIFSMATKGSLSPMQIFNDDERLLDCIKRTLKYAKRDTIAAVRSGLKTYKGNRGVGNFPPLWSKYIIDELFPNQKGMSLLDFSLGFGGRLIGSYASGKINYYMGIDPLCVNIDSAQNIYSLIKQHSLLADIDFNAKFINKPAEEALEEVVTTFDMVLTSPPYFDKEIYSNDDDQCYNKYATYEEWKQRWLRDVLMKSFQRLKPNGYMIIFMGSGNKVDIKKDCSLMLSDICRSSVMEYKFELPNLEYCRKNKNKKFDICFVCQKKQY